VADLDLDRETILQVTSKKKVPTPELRLHEDMALAKGLPPYGFVPVWPSPWESFALYRIAITGKGKECGHIIYFGRFDRALIQPPKRKSVTLFSAKTKKGEVPEGYPEFCDGEIHSFPRQDICFTSSALMKWYELAARRHQQDLDYEGRRIISLVADLGSQAQSITAQQETLRKPFPYHIIPKIEKI